MIGRTIFAYFLRRYLVIVAQFLIGVIVIAFLIDFAEMARRASSLEGYTFTLGIAMTLLKLPSLIEQTMPFVILFAAMSTLMTLNRKYELVVARSAGVSAWQFLSPLLVGSFIIGLFSVVVLNYVSASALAKSEEIEARLFQRSSQPASQQVTWLRQRTEEGVTIIGAKRTALQGLLLADTTFIRFNQDGDISERLDARQAILGNGAWELSDVTRLDSNGNRDKMASASVATGLQPEFVQERFADPQSIPLYELGAKIDAARAFGLSANAFRMQYHSLLALPPLLVAMTLIAATVSMRFARLGQSAVMILGGVFAGFLLYVVTVLVKTLGSGGLMPPVVAAWIPVILASLYGITFLLYKEDG